MENISDKEVVKKKKRRGRKKSTSKVASPSVKKEEVLFNTAHLEKIKEEVSEKIDTTKQVPQHVFSLKNLFMTVLFTCLLVLVIVAGYLIGLFESIKDDDLPVVDLNAINRVTGGPAMTVEGYDFVVPYEFEEVDSESLMKVNNAETGVNIEILEIVERDSIYDESIMDGIRQELLADGYKVYASYVLEENGAKYLIYTGVDSVDSEFRMLYAELEDGEVAKILITTEYEEEPLTDMVYSYVTELLNK